MGAKLRFFWPVLFAEWWARMTHTRHGRPCFLKPFGNLRTSITKNLAESWLLRLGTNPSPLAQDDSLLMAHSFLFFKPAFDVCFHSGISHVNFPAKRLPLNFSSPHITL